MHSGGFAIVESLDIDKIKAGYCVRAYIKHGIRDCGAGGVCYSGECEFKFDTDLNLIKE